MLAQDTDFVRDLAADTSKYLVIGERCGFANAEVALTLLGVANKISQDATRRGIALGRTLVDGMEVQAGKALMCRAVAPSRAPMEAKFREWLVVVMKGGR